MRTNQTDQHVDVFSACRPRLLGIACGMLGELGEAEGIVQEAWLRWDRADRAEIRSSEAFLVERAVLILRDAFDLDYAEIADVLGRSPANVRQIAVRARSHAGDQRRTRPVSAQEQERLAATFMAAALAGDMNGIRAALAADAILYSDGGGVVVATRKPIYGADKIARFLVGVQRKPAFVPDIEYELVRVNGDFGVRMASPTAGFLGIIAVQAQDGEIVAVRIFSNPARSR
jgi:RNA polymerase sigma-70 factor (ECF subfamily)